VGTIYNYVVFAEKDTVREALQKPAAMIVV
jgi:hypothetical protein